MSSNELTVPPTKFCAETAKVIIALSAAYAVGLNQNYYMLTDLQNQIKDLIKYGKLDNV